MIASLRQSSIAAFLACPRRMQFRYVDGLKEPTNEKMARGTAAHSAIEFALRRQISGAPATLDEVIANARDVAKRLDDEIDWSLEEPADRRAMGDRAAALAAHYVAHVAPTFQPLDVERRFDVTISGVPIAGMIDVVATDGVRDTKTTQRAPALYGEPRHRLQLGIYALALLRELDSFDEPAMTATIDALILSERNSKGVGLQRVVRHLPIVIDADDLRGEMDVAKDTITHVWNEVRVGNFPRNPIACSEWQKPCAFIERCQPHRASAIERAKAIEAP